MIQGTEENREREPSVNKRLLARESHRSGENGRHLPNSVISLDKASLPVLTGVVLASRANKGGYARAGSGNVGIVGTHSDVGNGEETKEAAESNHSTAVLGTFMLNRL